ncbi:NAD-dependent epimerase/dehydratase family protein [Amycolatopsis sp. cg13]|uniref:NAD-dependent epimerase/dehydratase family protein n=1 Tax=Amycolatopsis sp. cg13 TaxID=3238807 RepID=UPI0035261A29
MNDRAVVLGGTGFLGRQVCAGLAARGCDVVAIARRSADVPGARIVTADLATALARELFGDLRASLVVNAAGALWGAVTEEQMEYSNTRLVENVLAGLSPRTRFVQFGTVHEHGSVPGGVRLDASVPCAPRTPYGRTKNLATRAVLAATARGAVDGVVLRLSNVLGPGIPEASLPGKVAAVLAAAAREGSSATLDLFALRASRDFFDVRDLVSAVALAARTPIPGGVVLLGSGRSISVRSLVTDLVEISGVPARLSERAPQQTASHRSAEGAQEVDPGPASAVLNWQARHTLDDSLRALWESVRP